MARGRKVWTEETLAVPDLQDYLQDQTVMVFTNTADRSAQVPAPTEGMVSYLTASDSLWFHDGNSWRRLNGGQLLSTLNLTLAAAVSATQTTPFVMGTVTVPDPGIPYYVFPFARGEYGSAAAGTRWDSQLIVNNGGTDYTLGIDVKAESVGFSTLMGPGPMGKGGGNNPAPFTGSSTVRWQMGRVYGNGGGTFTGLNRYAQAGVYSVPLLAG